MTRSGQRAQGIAQFMPGTASERRLLDPFDPVQGCRIRRVLGNCAISSAIRPRPRPIMPVRAGCRKPRRHRLHAAGDPTTSLPSRDRRSKSGRRQDATASAGARAGVELPRVDGLAQGAPNPLRAVSNSTSRWRPRNCGAYSSPPIQPHKALAIMRAPEAVERSDWRSGPEPAQFRDANARHPSVLPGADRRGYRPEADDLCTAYAARRGCSAAQHGRAG